MGRTHDRCIMVGQIRSLSRGCPGTAAVVRAHEDRPIASTATHDGKVHVDVLSLKRTDGGTVTLRFVLANDGDGDFSMVLGNMHLVDLAARRSYRAGLMSSSYSTPPGRQVNCWATFAAPPEATKTLAVQFYENLDLLSGVPVAE